MAKPQKSNSRLKPFTVIISVTFILTLGQGFNLFAQSSISKTEASQLIQEFHNDPFGKEAPQLMDQLIRWMDETEDVYIFIGEAPFNEMLSRKCIYSRNLYLLMLSAMAKYDLDHPDDNIEKLEVDKAAGYACMCNGLNDILKKEGRIKGIRWFKRICRKRR